MTKEELQQLRVILREELEPVNKRLDGIEQRLKSLEQGQGQHKTVLKTLEVVLQELGNQINKIWETILMLATKKDVDMAVEAAKKELRADIYLLDAKLIRQVHSHEKRIENIEKHEGITNPDKH